MNQLRIICRKSRLSLLQANLVKQRIAQFYPELDVQIIGRASRGDRELNLDLSALDGSDFFTQEIFEALQNNEAELAVHSMKDMSADHFFGHDAFAVVDQDDVRDVAIFNPTIEKRIARGERIFIGTCSPRREEMAVSFLSNALPQGETSLMIDAKPIRGNVESRLKQLSTGQFDGIILATAGLNRLLASESCHLVQELLKGKKLMFLPLIECVPAPCQGAILVEANPLNFEVTAILKKINRDELFQTAFREKQLAATYGVGCLQKFGVTTLRSNGQSILYAGGEDQLGEKFSYYEGLPKLDIEDEGLFASTDYMKDFFDYEWSQDNVEIPQSAIFVSNHKSFKNIDASNKIVLASGTKTWLALAQHGVWVTASADGMGFEQFLPALQMPLIKIERSEVCIVTHKLAAERWREKGYAAVSSYELTKKRNDVIANLIGEASHIFWSSYSQYSSYKQYAKQSAIHCCAGGETASLIKQDGLSPIIFPTIKSFEHWRQTSTHSHNVG